MIRYQIRNEYGLSDPELYAAAPGEEQDDPEALLEGVAMAGLVGVLRQLGDLAEFAAEIFHDLHEDVMATASRGHSLMLRLQQLEAEFPAVEKAIISQTDHSHYPHDEGVGWHANIQIKQNMITQGDMPRFILDSYEECRGPPQLFTLDKFDVAGAGASLKRYSDPSFFKTEHASGVTETGVLMEKKPRRIKKKTMRWRKGATLESLLVASSEFPITPKDRISRKVPPRTTKLKSRHPRSPDHKTISRICREHLQDVILSQQKILSRYSARHDHVKFRSTGSSETASPFGEMDNFGAYVQSSGKLELTKVVPVNEYDTVEAESTPTDRSAYLDLGDKQVLEKQNEHYEQNGMACDSEKVPDCPNLQVAESNHRHSAHEEKPVLLRVPADIDGCTPDDIGSDQDNFIDALNNMDSEGEAGPETGTEPDPSANVEGIEPNCRSKEGENELYEESPEVGPAIDLLPGLKGSCEGGEPTCMDSPFLSDSAPAMSATNGPNSGRQLDGVDWTHDDEPFKDDDLMDVSSSSSVVSENADLQTNDDLIDCQQNQEEAFCSIGDEHAAIILGPDKQSPNMSSGLDGVALDKNDYIDNSMEPGPDIVLDDSSLVSSKPNDLSEDDQISFGVPDDLFLHPTKLNQEEIQELKKELDEGRSLDTDAPPGKPASLPDKDHVAVPEEIVADTTPTGIAGKHSSMHNNLWYESYDDEIAEHMHSVPDDGLSTHPNKNVSEDHQISVLEEGTCPTSCNVPKQNSKQASTIARDMSDSEDLPGVIHGLSPSQKETSPHEGEILAPASSVFNDDAEPLETGVLQARSTSSVPNTSSACAEQYALTEMKHIAEGGKIVVAKESTTSRFADVMVPPEEEFIGTTIYTENVDVLATNSTEEASRHDVQLQSSSLRKGLETLEATQRNLGAVDESRDHISEESMLQTDNTPPIQIETGGEKSGDRDDIQFLSSANFLEESGYQEELLEEASHNAEVVTLCGSDKDGAVSLKSNTVWKQPVDVDQDLAWGMLSQDSSSTNPFMDPAYMMSHTQVYPSPSTSCQPCFPEERDFLSELLVQHDKLGTAADSLWEPATPPDEAPLPSEVMTEEDFRSFCHEYHEIDFSASTQGCHDEMASDSNSISDAFLVSESDFPCSVSALPVKLDQEPCVHSKFGSQCVECSVAMDIQGTAVTFSGKEDPEDEKSRVGSDLDDPKLFSDNRNPELDMLSAPAGLQQEHGFSGVDSHSPPLLEKEKTGEECCSPSSNIVEVKQELEILSNRVPQSFINEMVDKVDVVVPMGPEIEARALDEYDNQDVPCCSTGEQNNDPTLGESVLLQEPEVCAFGEFDSPIIPLSPIDEIKDKLEASSLRTSFQAEQESECCTSGEHDSRIAQSSLLHDKIDESDGPPLSNAALLDQESEDCVPRGLDSRIPPCSSTDDSTCGFDHAPLGSSVLVDLQSEDHVLGDRDSQVTPCSLVEGKIEESKDGHPNCIIPEELEQEAHAFPESDSQVVRCSMNGDEVGEIDGPPLCGGQVESEYDCSTEFDSQTAPCSSNSGVPVETTLTSASVMPSIEEIYQLPPSTPPTVPFPHDSCEDPDKPPPLPPLQWRLGRPRLGLLSRKVCMAEPARRTEPVLQASSQDMDNRTRLDLLDGTDRSIKQVSSQAITEGTYPSCMMDGNEQSVEFGRSAVTDVARTEHNWPFSEASEDIKQQGHISSSAIEIEEHLDDTRVTSAAAVEKHMDTSGIAHGEVLYPSNPHASENSEHPSHTHPAAYEDDKSMDGHNAASGMVTATTGHVSENRYYQQPQHDELFSETSDHEQHISLTPEDEGVTHHSSTSEAPSDQAGHSAPGTLLEEGNSQESQIFQKQNVESPKDGQVGGPLPREESMAPQDFPHDEHNSERERENIRQPSGPGLFVVWPSDKNNMVSGLDEATYARSEEPPVMGWTVGPQMIHPKYGISVEESEFEPNMTDNHLTKKPLSIRNIPRNPLVDAVAAHDRSSMRKVSELAPPTDKPKSEERNLLLEQIRNKTFNLKPVAPDKPTAMRSPARVNTRNLKVAAIIEKANAIRQAVGSDDEDADSWSDA